MTDGRPARRRGIGWIIIVLLVCGAGFVGWKLLHPAARRAPAPAPISVGMATAAKSDLPVILDALGAVTPLATVTVKTQISGQLTQIGFREGQTVKKGDFLAQIDPRPYQAALDQAQGTLLKDQATLKQAQADLARYQKLASENSIARQQAQDQQFLVEQEQGTVKADQGTVENAQLNLQYCRITAPTDGIVGLRQVDQGNYVQASDTNGIVVITEVKPISVLFSLPEDDLPQVLAQTRAGKTLQVTAYDRASIAKLATGTLVSIDNQVDSTTGTVKMRAQFDNDDGALFPDQFVNIQLLVQTLQGVTTAPVAAIQRGAPGIFVYKLSQDNKVALTKVTLGASTPDIFQITSGLNPGDQVVVDGADKLRDGSRVTPQSATAASTQTGGVESVTPGNTPASGAPNPPAGGDPGSGQGTGQGTTGQ